MKKTKKQNYDIIGDIHGHADTLRALLEKLGYVERDGCYRHPERKVIFVGDFLDRGPKIRETLQIVKAMVEAGEALAVLGNHEVNAIRYHTNGPDGKPLRPHTAKNVRQHLATLEQLAAPHADEWNGWLAWFKSLPFYLAVDGVRVVHAAWCVNATSLLGARRFDDHDFLLAASREGTPEHAAVMTLVNGPEILLPEGAVFIDKEGHEHECIRARWFGETYGEGATYRDVVFPPSECVPEAKIPRELLDGLNVYPETETPVLFGHYWMPPTTPRAVARNAASVDFSVAGKAGGMLVAYRFDGEIEIDPRKFVFVLREVAAKRPAVLEEAI